MLPSQNRNSIAKRCAAMQWLKVLETSGDNKLLVMPKLQSR